MRTPYQSAAEAWRRCCVLRDTPLPSPSVSVLCLSSPFLGQTMEKWTPHHFCLISLFIPPLRSSVLAFTKHRVGRREFTHSSRSSHHSTGLVLLCNLEKSISFGQGIYRSIILCKHTNRSLFIGTFAICLAAAVSLTHDDFFFLSLSFWMPWTLTWLLPLKHTCVFEFLDLFHSLKFSTVVLKSNN